MCALPASTAATEGALLIPSLLEGFAEAFSRLFRAVGGGDMLRDNVDGVVMMDVRASLVVVVTVVDLSLPVLLAISHLGRLR